MYSCWQREKSSHCHLGNNFLLPVSLHTHPEVPIQKKGLINPKVPKQLIYNNLHVERNHCKSCWGGQEAIKTEDCFETMVLVEFSLLTFLFSKHRRIPAYLLHFPNTQQENNFFRALLILKKSLIFVIYWCLGSQLSTVGRKERHHKTPSCTGNPLKHLLHLPTLACQQCFRSWAEPQLWTQSTACPFKITNILSHALCFPCSKYYSWSILGLDGIYWENDINVSDEDYVGETRYAP